MLIGRRRLSYAGFVRTLVYNSTDHESTDNERNFDSKSVKHK